MEPLYDYIRRMGDEIIRYYTSHGADTPLSDFFTHVREMNVRDAEPLLRRVVKAHCSEYRDTLSIEAVDELAEGAEVDLVRNPDGKEFYRINIGIGDTPADHYFSTESDEPLFMVFESCQIFKAKKRPNGRYVFLDEEGESFADRYRES